MKRINLLGIKKLKQLCPIIFALFYIKINTKDKLANSLQLDLPKNVFKF